MTGCLLAGLRPSRTLPLAAAAGPGPALDPGDLLLCCVPGAGPRLLLLVVAGARAGAGLVPLLAPVVEAGVVLVVGFFSCVFPPGGLGTAACAGAEAGLLP